MSEISIDKVDRNMEKRRISISSKRQITIPSKYYDALGLDKEVDLIYSNNMLILTPVYKEEPGFSEEILSDLINKGYTGKELLNEFKRINRNVRPTIEKIIEEADELAFNASKYYVDRTDDIFGVNETEE